jgi:hypothetical protein
MPSERKEDGGADGRMAGEWQLHARREDAHARGAAGRRLEHEDRLRMAELARDRLHAAIVEGVGIEHDRKRVALEAPVREHVEGREG